MSPIKKKGRDERKCILKCAVVDDFNALRGIKVHVGMCRMTGTRSGAERVQLRSTYVITDVAFACIQILQRSVDLAYCHSYHFVLKASADVKTSKI